MSDGVTGLTRGRQRRRPAQLTFAERHHGTDQRLGSGTCQEKRRDYQLPPPPGEPVGEPQPQGPVEQDEERQRRKALTAGWTWLKERAYTCHH